MAQYESSETDIWQRVQTFILTKLLKMTLLYADIGPKFNLTPVTLERNIPKRGYDI